MNDSDVPAKWERFVARHERGLLLIDLVFTLGVAILGLLVLSGGEPGGWLYLSLTLAGASWMVTTRLQARRVRQYDARRLGND